MSFLDHLIYAGMALIFAAGAVVSLAMAGDAFTGIGDGMEDPLTQIPFGVIFLVCSVAAAVASVLMVIATITGEVP